MTTHRENTAALEQARLLGRLSQGVATILGAAPTHNEAEKLRRYQRFQVKQVEVVVRHDQAANPPASMSAAEREKLKAIADQGAAYRAAVKERLPADFFGPGISDTARLRWLDYFATFSESFDTNPASSSEEAVKLARIMMNLRPEVWKLIRHDRAATDWHSLDMNDVRVHALFDRLAKLVYFGIASEQGLADTLDTMAGFDSAGPGCAQRGRCLCWTRTISPGCGRS